MITHHLNTCRWLADTFTLFKFWSVIDWIVGEIKDTDWSKSITFWGTTCPKPIFLIIFNSDLTSLHSVSNSKKRLLIHCIQENYHSSLKVQSFVSLKSTWKPLRKTFQARSRSWARPPSREGNGQIYEPLARNFFPHQFSGRLPNVEHGKLIRKFDRNFVNTARENSRIGIWRCWRGLWCPGICNRLKS